MKEKAIVYLSQFLSLLLLVLICLDSNQCEQAIAYSGDQKIKVALFLDQGAHAREELCQTLRSQPDMRVTIIYGDDVRAGRLRDFDVLVVPGGSGREEAASLEEDGTNEIRRFVQNGGIYMGVCAGFYLLTETRPQYLGLLPLTTSDSDNWRRGEAMLPIEFTPLGMQVFAMPRAKTEVLYHNGPVININGRSNKSKSDIIPLCFFRDEIVAPGGEPGVMLNAPAIILGRFGKGLVLGISPHPEATPGLETIEVNAIRWLYAHRNQDKISKID